MKKLLYLIMAAATLLFAAGCQQETGLSGDDGSLADVTFRVALDGMQTKAFSDGTKADSLVVMVYKDNNGFEFLENVEPQEKPEFDDNLTAEVNLKLVRGETYRIVFWAMHNNPSLYIFDKENAAVTVNIDGLYSNDDNRDAFYGVWEGAIGRDGVEDGDVNLYRPFAQLNVLTSEADWQAAIDNGITFAGSAMTVKAPTKLNFFDGSVEEEAVYEFAQSTIEEPVNIPGYEEYKYVAMNYILTDSGSNVGETGNPLKIEVYRESGLLVDFSLINVPVRRNYRTILVGDIFCADAIFQVTIQNEFGGDETIPLENAENQVITFDPDSAPGQDPAFEYDEQSLTGEYTMTVGETLDFAGAFSSNSTFDPVYTSTDEAVGKFAAQVGDAPTLFTALAAGQTIVKAHFNAVINGEEVKAEAKNFKSADVEITITVVDEAEGYTVTIDQDIIDQEEEVGGVWIVDGDDEYESQFQAGATVNLIYDPIGDYDLTALWYLDENEEPVDIDFADGEASFIMPEYDVIIFATFEEAGDEPLEAGDPWSYTFYAKVFDANGQTKSLTDPDTQVAVNWTADGNGGYWGYDNVKGQQFGSGNKPAKSQTLTANFGADYGVQEVIVEASGASSIAATMSVTVGDVVLKCDDAASVSLTTTSTAYTFTTEDGLAYAGDIVIAFTQTSSKAIYVNAIAVNQNVGGDEPDEYYITLNQTNFGTLECDQDNNYAPAGETVTVTLTPAENCHYLENSVSVTTETSPNGIEFDIVESPTAEGVFIVTFTMPAEDVTVSADFEEDPSGIAVYPVIDGNFSEWDNIPGVEGTDAILLSKGIATADKIFFYIEVDKTKVNTDTYSYANRLYLLLGNGDETGNQTSAFEGYYDKDLNVWLYTGGYPVMSNWDSGFASKSYVVGNVVKYEFCWNRSVSDALVGSEVITVGMRLRDRQVDTTGGGETKYGTDEYFAFSPAKGSDFVVLPNSSLDAPEPVLPQSGPSTISIDGDMSDWESIPGVFASSVYAYFKAAFDADYIYLYSRRSMVRYNDIWGGAGYFYYAFDTDNDPTTGDAVKDTVPYEAWFFLYPFAGSAETPAFNDTPSGGGDPSSSLYANALLKGLVSENGVETEVRIPRSNFTDNGISFGSTISITSWGNKDCEKVTLSIVDFE